MKNGEIIEPIANAPYAAPISCPLNFRTLARYVPMLTYQQPQIKHCRNMKRESVILTAVRLVERLRMYGSLHAKRRRIQRACGRPSAFDTVPVPESIPPEQSSVPGSS